jgi:hypothetical protein
MRIDNGVYSALSTPFALDQREALRMGRQSKGGQSADTILQLFGAVDSVTLQLGSECYDATIHALEHRGCVVQREAEPYKVTVFMSPNLSIKHAAQKRFALG